MHGHEHILFEEAEIEVGPGLVVLVDAEAYVHWTLNRGELTWQAQDWTGPDRKAFSPEFEKALTPKLSAYIDTPKHRDYIEREIIERNGIVVRDEEHRLPVSAFL